MNLYRFKTFRTSYYFPSLTKERKFLYGLYTPFGGGLAKLYWNAFCEFSLVRILTKVYNPDKEFPYSKIMNMMPKDSIVSFNLGTPGPEQKISMLGLSPDGSRFFAKYSENEGAIRCSRNEIKILSELKDQNLAPELYDYKDGGDFVFFRTSCADGKNPSSLDLNDDVIDLAVKINKINLEEKTLCFSLSHGDFTPWNLIVSPGGEYKMIDWEMADRREIGYDIFTYIVHVGALMKPNNSLMTLINENRIFINKYFASFGIDDWTQYLTAFAKRRIEFEKYRKNDAYAEKFKCLL